MKELTILQSDYLSYCSNQRKLNPKILKAYKIDLNQFLFFINCNYPSEISTAMLEKYIENLHDKYKPKTVKRKIASTKAFFHYLEYKEEIHYSPFNKMEIRFREPITLPKTIPLSTIEQLLTTIYLHKKKCAYTIPKESCITRCLCY